MRGATGTEWIKTGKYERFLEYYGKWGKDTGWTNFGEETAKRTIEGLASLVRQQTALADSR